MSLSIADFYKLCKALHVAFVPPGSSPVISVNGMDGNVVVDGTNIDSTITPTNFPVTGQTLDEFFTGINTAFGNGPWSLVTATVDADYPVVGKPTIIIVNDTTGVSDIILPDMLLANSYKKGSSFLVVNIGKQARNVVNYLVDLVVPVQAGTTMEFNVLDDSTQDGTFSFTPTNNYGSILSGGGTYNLTYPLSEVYWVQDVGSIVFPDATDPDANGSPKSILIFSPNVSEVLVYNNALGFLGAIPYYSGYQFTNFSNATAAGDWRSVEIALSIPVLGQIFAQQYSVRLTADATMGFGGFGAANPFVWKDPTVLTDITLTIDNAGTTYPGFPISVHNFKGNTGAIIVALTGAGSPTFDNDGVTTILTLNPGDGVKLTSVNSGGVTGPSVDYIYRASIPNQIRWVVQGPNSADTPDAGTVDKPYATPEYALTQITDASPTNVYELVVVGYFTGVVLTLKPCITYDFTGAFLDYSGYMELDASFDATSNARIDVLGGKQRWPGSINLVLPGTNQGTVMFYGCDFKDTQSVNVLQDSGSSNQCVVGVVDCVALPDGSVNPPVAGPNFYVENATLIHLDSSAASIEVINNSSAAGNRAVINSCLNPTCSYTFSSIDSPPLSVDMEASPITGILNLDGNTVALAIDAASWSDNVTYTNGSTPAQITFKNTPLPGTSDITITPDGSGNYVLTLPLKDFYQFNLSANNIILPDQTQLGAALNKPVFFINNTGGYLNVLDVTLTQVSGVFPNSQNIIFNTSLATPAGSWIDAADLINKTFIVDTARTAPQITLSATQELNIWESGFINTTYINDDTVGADKTITTPDLSTAGQPGGFGGTFFNPGNATSNLIFSTASSGAGVTINNDGVTTSLTIAPGQSVYLETALLQSGQWTFIASSDTISFSKGTFPQTFIGPWAAPQIQDVNWTKSKEGLVSLTIPNFGDVATINSIISNTVPTRLPAFLRPATTALVNVNVRTNTVCQLATGPISPLGDFNFYADNYLAQFLIGTDAGLGNSNFNTVSVTLTYDTN